MGVATNPYVHAIGRSAGSKVRHRKLAGTLDREVDLAQIISHPLQIRRLVAEPPPAEFRLPVKLPAQSECSIQLT